MTRVSLTFSALVEFWVLVQMLTWFLLDDVVTAKLGAEDHLGLEHPNRNRTGAIRYESLNIR
jgi:hypothetical protein